MCFWFHVYSLRKCGIRCCACFCIFKFWLPNKAVSFTKKDISTTFINWFISAYDSTAQNLAARIPQKWPLLDQKMRILWHNANSQELLNSENDWPWRCSTTYPKAKKGHISPWDHEVQKISKNEIINGAMHHSPLKIQAWFTIIWLVYSHFVEEGKKGEN